MTHDHTPSLVSTAGVGLYAVGTAASDYRWQIAGLGLTVLMHAMTLIRERRRSRRDEGVTTFWRRVAARNGERAEQLQTELDRLRGNPPGQYPHSPDVIVPGTEGEKPKA